MASWHELDTQNPKTFPRTLNFTNKAIEKSFSFRYYWFQIQPIRGHGRVPQKVTLLQEPFTIALCSKNCMWLERSKESLKWMNSTAFIGK